MLSARALLKTLLFLVPQEGKSQPKSTGQGCQTSPPVCFPLLRERCLLNPRNPSLPSRHWAIEDSFYNSKKLSSATVVLLYISEYSRIVFPCYCILHLALQLLLSELLRLLLCLAVFSLLSEQSARKPVTRGWMTGGTLCPVSPTPSQNHILQPVGMALTQRTGVTGPSEAAVPLLQRYKRQSWSILIWIIHFRKQCAGAENRACGSP